MVEPRDAAHPFEHIQAIGAGHHQIEQDQVGCVRLQVGQGFLSAEERGGGRADAAQQQADHREQLGVVIDHDNRWFRV